MQPRGARSAAAPDRHGGALARVGALGLQVIGRAALPWPAAALVVIAALLTARRPRSGQV